MTTYRLRITLDSYGSSEDYAEQFLEAFVATHPEVGPVISQNLMDETLTVIFSLEANDHDEALERAKPIFIESATASGLDGCGISELTVSRVLPPAKKSAPAARPALQPC